MILAIRIHYQLLDQIMDALQIGCELLYLGCDLRLLRLLEQSASLDGVSKLLEKFLYHSDFLISF